MAIKFVNSFDMNQVIKNRQKKPQLKNDFEQYAQTKGVDTEQVDKDSKGLFSEYANTNPPKLSEEEENLNKIRADAMNGAEDIPSDYIFNEDRARELGFDDEQITGFKYGKMRKDNLDYLAGMGLYLRAEPNEEQSEQYQPTDKLGLDSSVNTGHRVAWDSNGIGGTYPKNDIKASDPPPSISMDYGYENFANPPSIQQPNNSNQPQSDQSNEHSFFKLLSNLLSSELGTNSRYRRGF